MGVPRTAAEKYELQDWITRSSQNIQGHCTSVDSQGVIENVVEKKKLCFLRMGYASLLSADNQNLYQYIFVPEKYTRSTM